MTNNNYWDIIEETAALVITACVLYILGSFGVINNSTATISGGISWGGNSPATTTVNIENTKLLTVAVNTTVVVRTTARSISTSLTKSAKKAKTRAMKSEYMLANEVIFGSNRRGSNTLLYTNYKDFKKYSSKSIKKEWIDFY